MRNTALILGVLSGLWGMIIGFVSGAYIAFVNWFGEADQVISQVENPLLLQVMGLVAPVLALVGGGLVHAQPKISGPLLILSALGMFYAFDWKFFTMFPITLCAIGGGLAILAAYLKSE